MKKIFLFSILLLCISFLELPRKTIATEDINFPKELSGDQLLREELIVMCEIIKDMARKWKKRLREEHANYNQRKKNKRGK